MPTTRQCLFLPCRVLPMCLCRVVSINPPSAANSSCRWRFCFVRLVRRRLRFISTSVFRSKASCRCRNRCCTRRLFPRHRRPRLWLKQIHQRLAPPTKRHCSHLQRVRPIVSTNRRAAIDCWRYSWRRRAQLFVATFLVVVVWLMLR